MSSPCRAPDPCRVLPSRFRDSLAAMSDQRTSVLPPPNSWLVPAVVTTLCCFPVTGVIAVFYAAQVRARWDNGDVAGAHLAARRARALTLLGFALFLLAVAVLVATGALFSFVDRVRE